MLATLAAEPFSREGWLFETKFDGVRAIAYRSGGEVRLLSRNLIDQNSRYPEIVAAIAAQKAESFIVDGEIVAFRNGVTSFEELQQRMQVGNPPVELRKRVPVCFYVFDLLYFEGSDLRAMPLRDRKEALRSALRFKDPLRFTEHRETEGEALYREACAHRWEGIIAKNGESKYVSGRSREWLKFKCVADQEFVIGGYTDPEGKRTGFGALLIGYYANGKLRYAGKTGTGFDNQTLTRLTGQLSKLASDESPFVDITRLKGVHWVKPALVAQIGFTEWTSDGKLRHPRFLGLRDDKNPEDVKRES